jgi:hypothetical protein
MPYTGSIAGHICVLAGGGEDSLVTLSPALSESFRCWVSENCYWLRAVSDRSHRFVRQRGIEQRAERDHVLHRAADIVVGDDAAGRSRSGREPSRPRCSADDTAREAPHVDPRTMRAIVDRGVVAYASAKTDAERARGARLIQTAALMGYPPARDLLARNYPQSEAVRSVVPATDVIRYALGPVMDVTATSEDSKQIFLALGNHFALQGQLDLSATQILFTARRPASAAWLSNRHFTGFAGARARSL